MSKASTAEQLLDGNKVAAATTLPVDTELAFQLVRLKLAKQNVGKAMNASKEGPLLLWQLTQ